MNDYPFLTRFPMRWGEMDALGHANNVRYFSWFESARATVFHDTEFFARLPEGIGPVVAKATCEYRRPVVWPAELVVGTRVARLGQSSLTIEHAVAREDAPEALCAVGETVVVLVDYATGRAVPIPEAIRTLFEEAGADRPVR